MTTTTLYDQTRWLGARAARAALALACVLALTACGDYGGSGGGTGGGGVVLASTPTGGSTGATQDEMIAAFSTTVLPLNQQYCATCHAGAGPGSPHIAHPDPATAYSQTMDTQKMSLAAPDTSRLVRRLAVDFHHCWGNCTMNGMEMQMAIQAFADAINFDAGGGQSVDGLASNTRTFANGVEDNSAERYSGNVIALYEFKEGDGTVALDSSGVDPAMDLTLEGPTFMSNHGIDIETGRAIATRETSRKLYDRIGDAQTGSQQFSVEAWVVPENTDQDGPARIVTYSNGTNRRNFHLGQVMYNYNFRNRTMAVEGDLNGNPSLQTRDADQDLQATLQHVVVTYDQYRGRRIYVNGDFTDDEEPLEASRLWNWDPSYRFVLGNETSNNRQWVGKLQLVAVYDVALTDAQIRQNFLAGIGKKLTLSFDVSQWAGGLASVEFVVSELDDGSYLFCEPTFVAQNPGSLRVANMRISVNGQIPAAGQAFSTIDTVITQSQQLLSRGCSVVAKGPGGVDTDVFALEFEVLGQFQEPVVVTFPPPPPPVPSGQVAPGVGVRTFARVNETMSSVTGVDPNTNGPRQAFEELTQSLPSTTELGAFSSSHQIAIAKLALEYCDRLVETPALRSSFFPGFDFGAPATTSLDSPGDRALIADPLASSMVGANIVDQPTLAEVSTIVDDLLVDLTNGCTPATCDAQRARSIVKGACAAVLGSAAVTIH